MSESCKYYTSQIAFAIQRNHTNENGVYDDDEVDPSFYCGTGTEWSEAEGKCVALPQCTGDVDLNGSINVSDLLLFLSVFGSDC